MFLFILGLVIMGIPMIVFAWPILLLMGMEAWITGEDEPHIDSPYVGVVLCVLWCVALAYTIYG